MSADLSVRWCSAYLKIDVMAAALRGQDRFLGKRILVVTGERAAESSARAKYNTFEPDRCDSRNGTTARRHVDHWRPVHGFSTAQVWELIGKYRVNPHPAYRAGFGRVSCMFCIFGSANQCASARAIDPVRFAKVTGYETEFGHTIHRNETFTQRADRGTAYAEVQAESEACKSHTFDEPVFLGAAWKLPAGAFAESCGPV